MSASGQTFDVQALLNRNISGLANHHALPSLPEIKASGQPPPFLVISCADPRCVPETFLHLNAGEAAVFRNVGGHAESIINDVLALDSLLNLSAILVIKHTDCGTTYFKDEDVKALLKSRVPDGDDEMDSKSFGAMDTSFGDETVKKSIEKSVKFLKTSPYVREDLKTSVYGYLFDIKTGALTSVAA